MEKNIDITMAEQEAAAEQAIERLSEMRDAATERFYRELPEPSNVSVVGASRYAHKYPPVWHVASQLEQLISGDTVEPKYMVEINKFGKRHFRKELGDTHHFICGFFLTAEQFRAYDNMMRNRRRLALDEPYFEVALRASLGYSLLTVNGYFRRYSSTMSGHNYICDYSYGGYSSTKKKMMHITGIDVVNMLVYSDGETHSLEDFSSMYPRKPLTQSEIEERPKGDWL